MDDHGSIAPSVEGRDVSKEEPWQHRSWVRGWELLTVLLSTLTLGGGILRLT